MARLKRGTFYWTCDVNADSEEEAVVAAENLFEAETVNAKDWQFDEFQAEPA
jgi:hypothetical protein